MGGGNEQQCDSLRARACTCAYGRVCACACWHVCMCGHAHVPRVRMGTSSLAFECMRARFSARVNVCVNQHER